MALVDRTADNAYYFTDPSDATVDYTINRKSSVSTDIKARNICYCIATFDKLPSRWVTVYYNSLLLTASGTAYTNLLATMASKESDGVATNVATVKSYCVRTKDWVN